jgi:hypothetical protein
LSIVIQKMRQLRMQNSEMRFANRSAVRNLDSSALQPDFAQQRITKDSSDSSFHLQKYPSNASRIVGN